MKRFLASSEKKLLKQKRILRISPLFVVFNNYYYLQKRTRKAGATLKQQKKGETTT
jgi:hypothetical protein